MTFPDPRPLLAALVATAACVSAPALADTAPTFKQLMTTSALAPRRLEADAGLAQANFRLDQSKARLNPSLSLTSENFAGSGDYRGAGASETTLSVEQPLELAGQRRARIAVAQAGLDLATARRQQSYIDFAGDLALACIDAEAAQARLQLAHDNLALTLDDERSANALVAAGREAELRGVQARAAVQSAQADLDQARSSHITALARLSALAGSETPFTAVPDELIRHADNDETPQAVDPQTTPAYLSAVAARDEASHRIKLEQTRAMPDVTVSVGVRRLHGDKAHAMVAGVSLPFPLFDRNTGNIRAATAERDAADARLAQARLDATADSHAAVAAAVSAHSRLLASRSAEQAAEQAYRLTRIGYDSGKIALFEVLDARRALTEARTRVLNARIDRLYAEAALARLRGVTPFGDL